ncbi:tripartite tricarboxylate transporter TctB family protein [Pacificoceanicola onchidii]|uniref:tripartite tricarboxylate transporter TctB family protein n=1 Tax=Pacificoceanicola onchidii TaxID=2562685 RepID=UPI0010A67B0C|nr:tripartite tricarboxylate transporter TctB family protein [Pacificoceanicola onchidii]
MTSRSFEFAVAITLLGIGIAILIYTGTVFVDAGYGDGDALQNAGLFPRIVAWGLIALSSMTLVSQIAGMVSDASEEGAMPDYDRALRIKAILHLVLVAIYLSVLRFVGYDISTPIFLFLLFRLLGARWVEAALLGIIISLLLAFVFESGLNVIFPVGRLGQIF